MFSQIWPFHLWQFTVTSVDFYPNDDDINLENLSALPEKDLD